MQIQFSNDEIRKIICAHAQSILNIEIDDSEEVVCELDGYGGHSVKATVHIEKRETELKAVA